MKRQVILGLAALLLALLCACQGESGSYYTVWVTYSDGSFWERSSDNNMGGICVNYWGGLI